jgi:hypothetical protein
MYHLVVFVMQLPHRFIRPSYHQFTGTYPPFGQPFAYFDLPGVMSRRFGQQFPDMSVSRLGNTSMVPSTPTGKLTGYQPQVGHKRPGTGKSPEVPYLTYQSQCRQVVNPPECPQFLYFFPIFTLFRHFFYPFFHPLNPFRQTFQRAQVLLKGLFKLQPPHPFDMKYRPVPFTLVSASVPQQKRLHPLFHPGQIVH